MVTFARIEQYCAVYVAPYQMATGSVEISINNAQYVTTSSSRFYGGDGDDDCTRAGRIVELHRDC